MKKSTYDNQSLSIQETEKKLLSIIVPCFNEEEVIPIFHEAISKIRGELPVDTELIYIDDGSTDGTNYMFLFAS